LQEYSRPKSGGIIGISLEEGDTLIDVVLTQPGDEVILSSRRGMAIRFAESDARAMGRNTKGVRGINLQEGDEVVNMVVADSEGFLLTVCEKGYGKRTPFGANIAGEEPPEAESEAEEAEVEEREGEAPAEPGAAEAESAEGEEPGKYRGNMRYRKQRRGGKGLRDIRTSDRNGPVVGAISVREEDDIMLITVQGMVNRTHVNEIRVVGRNTQGVRVIGLNEGDKIASIAKIAREEDVGGESNEIITEGPEDREPKEPTADQGSATDEPPPSPESSE